MAGTRSPAQAEFDALNFVPTDTPEVPNVGKSLFMALDGMLKIIDTGESVESVGGGISAAVLLETKNPDVNGGGMTVYTWNTRELNEILGDTGIVSLSSNQFTPVPGTYLAFGYCNAYQIIRHQSRLYNVTQSQNVFTGSSEYAGSGQLVGNKTMLVGVFVANGTDVYEMQHISTDSPGILARGTSVGGALTVEKEVYASLALVKIG